MSRASVCFCMAWPTDTTIRLAIRQKSQDRFVSLLAPRATVEYYGWDKVFPVWRGKYTNQTPTRRSHLWPDRRAFKLGGRRRLVISSIECRQGTPKGCTRQFRVTTDASLEDLINIAQAADRKFGWMTDFSGKRIRWEEWMLLPLRDSYLSMDVCNASMAA